MPSPLRSIAAALACAALLVGCTGTPEPETSEPFLVADEPLWGLVEAPLTPVVFAQDRAVLHDSQFLSVRDATSGELIWRLGHDVEVIGGVGESYVQSDPIVVGSGADAVVITRFTALTNQTGNRVDDLSYAGLMALSLTDGQLVWRADAVELERDTNIGASVSLIAANDEIVLLQVYGPEPGRPELVDYRLVAFDVADGTQLWSVPGVRGEYLSDDTVGVTLSGTAEPTTDSIFTGEGVAVLDAETGAERWRLDAEQTRLAAGNAHALASYQGRDLERTVAMLNVADGSQLDLGEQETAFCAASEIAVACTGGGELIAVDQELTVARAELETHGNVESVHGDRIILAEAGSDAAPTVWTPAARPVETNLPGRVLGMAEDHVAVGVGGDWAGEVLIYRPVTGTAGMTPSPQPKPPTDFPVPSDPSDYQAPRPAPLAAPITLGDQLWQQPAPRPVFADFHGNDLIVFGPRAEADAAALLQVLDTANGTPRWELTAGALLPGGSGEYLWFNDYENPTPFLVEEGQGLLLVNYQSNSCASAADACPDGFTTGFGVAALSLTDGSIVWRYVSAQRDAVAPSDDSTFWNWGGSVLTGAAAGVAVFTTSTEYYSPNPRTDLLTAVDAATGTELWSRPGVLGKVVTDQSVLVAVANGDDYDEDQLIATESLDLQTGESGWRLETPGRWPVAGTAEQVALRDWTPGGAAHVEIIATADGAPVLDLGDSHWDCRSLDAMLACGSTFGVKVVPDSGPQWLLNPPDELSVSGLDAKLGERYFVSSHDQNNFGADSSLMLDANGTPLGELPGRVLVANDEFVVLLSTATVTLYRYQG